MSTIFNNLGIDIGYIVIALAALVIILLVVVIILLIQVKKLNTRYSKFMKGKNGEELEQVIYERFGELDIMQKIATQHALEIKNLKRQFRSSFSKVGMVKYDAFNQMGGQLSFCLALLDENNNGFIINSVHSTEGCYSYTKEIKMGESSIPLGKEEEEALAMAMGE